MSYLRGAYPVNQLWFSVEISDAPAFALFLFVAFSLFLLLPPHCIFILTAAIAWDSLPGAYTCRKLFLSTSNHDFL